MANMLRIEVDENTCMRSGQCYVTHPELLQPDDDDLPVPTQDEFDESEREAIEDVVSVCPTGAIRLIEST